MGDQKHRLEASHQWSSVTEVDLQLMYGVVIHIKRVATGLRSKLGGGQNNNSSKTLTDETTVQNDMQHDEADHRGLLIVKFDASKVMT